MVLKLLRLTTTVIQAGLVQRLHDEWHTHEFHNEAAPTSVAKKLPYQVQSNFLSLLAWNSVGKIMSQTGGKAKHVSFV